MGDRCDAGCGRHTLVVWWHHDHGELHLCGVHDRGASARLTDEGWQVMADDRVRVG